MFPDATAALVVYGLEMFASCRFVSLFGAIVAGLVGFELIAGVPAYSTGSVKDILYSHVNDDIPLLPNKTDPLNRLFNGMLQNTPSKRFQDVQTVMSLLDNLA